MWSAPSIGGHSGRAATSMGNAVTRIGLKNPAHNLAFGRNENVRLVYHGILTQAKDYSVFLIIYGMKACGKKALLPKTHRERSEYRSIGVSGTQVIALDGSQITPVGFAVVGTPGVDVAHFAHLEIYMAIRLPNDDGTATLTMERRL